MNDETTRTPDPFAAFFDMQGEAMREMWSQFVPAAVPIKDWSDIGAWAENGQKLQAMWMEHC